jgi:peptidoglycan/LPS O-acetylase OafA/YrhL
MRIVRPPRGRTVHKDQQRIRYLDGLRGVSIALVMVWHFYGPTYARFLPFGDAYAGVPVISDGWAGVEMFFLISGFVIFMTLERSSGFVDFMLRRWKRLFPAMLVASVLLFAVDRLTDLQGPYSGARLQDVVPGLLFVSPAFLRAIVPDIRSLDNVFWSLYAEVAFYIIFALAYRVVGWRWAVAFLVLLSLIARPGLGLLAEIGAPGAVQRLLAPMGWLNIGTCGWFAAGALFAKWFESRDRRLFAVGLGVAALAIVQDSLVPGRGVSNIVMMVALTLLFCTAPLLPALQRVLASRPFQFMGLISYPLYLIHSNLGVSLIARLAERAPGLPASLVPVPVIVLVCTLAWVIATRAEPAVARALSPPLARFRAMLGVQAS